MLIINRSSDSTTKSPGNADEHYLLRQYRAVQKLVAVISAYSDPRETLYEALKVIAETLEVKTALIMEFDPRLNALRVLPPIYSYNRPFPGPTEFEKVCTYLDEPATTVRAFVSGQPAYSNDEEQSSVKSKKINPESIAHNILAVPVFVQGEKRGVCVLVNKTAGDFEEQDIEDLQALTSVIANLLKTITLVSSLESEHRRHVAVLDAAVDGFVEVSPDLKITMFSKGAENLTGWKAEEALGRACHEILAPHSPDAEALCNTCPLQRAFRTGNSISDVETLIRTREGEDNWVSTSYNSVTDQHGQVVSGIIAIKDIYRIKALSDELRQQSQQQETLLAVNNAINGLSNIEEIYRVSLDEISNAINFDLGVIHSIDPDSSTLVLMTLLEKEAEGPVKPEDSVMLTTGGTSLRLLQSNSNGMGGAGISIEEEHLPIRSRVPLRRTTLRSTLLTSGNDQNHSLMVHHAHECEALRQNEPYMSVNLPGKPVCDVLREFEGLQSHLCVPIKTNERTYGVLHLASRKPYAFWGSDFVLALSICKQVAVAAERAHLFEQIDRLARTDPLTGLYNKREFWERIDREIRRSERRNSPLSLMMIDLDRLKWINDCYGHAHGDALLSRLGELVREQCRASDIAFRYGGDELCVLMPDTTTEEARMAADRLRRAARLIKITSDSEQIIIGEEIEVTMSIGLAGYPNESSDAAELFDNSDAAMYRAKETGKDRTVVFDPLIDLNKGSYRRRQSNREYVDSRLNPPQRQIS
jgi:diguanylate cyclase (GGDEF)-like protein/PAS domain S-box-containing protein